MPTELLVTLSHHAADACWYLAARSASRPRPAPASRDRDGAGGAAAFVALARAPARRARWWRPPRAASALPARRPLAGVAGRARPGLRGRPPLGAAGRDDPLVGAAARACCWPRSSAAGWRWWARRCSRSSATRMADSGLLGVGAGAALGAVLAVRLGWAGDVFLALPLAAFAGAMAAVARRLRAGARGAARPSLHGLLLTGLAVSALAGAGTSVLLVATEEFRVKTVLFWLAGGLEGRGWTHLQLGRLADPRRRALLLARSRVRSTCCPWARTRRPRSACPSTPRGSRPARPGRAGGGRGHGGRRLRALRRPRGAARAAAAGGLARPPPAARLVPGRRAAGGAGRPGSAHAQRRMDLPLGSLTAFVGAPYFLFALRGERGPPMTRPLLEARGLVGRARRAAGAPRRRPRAARRARRSPSWAPTRAGKSTLVRALAGLLPAAAGEVRVDGRAARELAARRAGARHRAGDVRKSEAPTPSPSRTRARSAAIPTAGRSARCTRGRRRRGRRAPSTDRHRATWPTAAGARSPPASASSPRWRAAWPRSRGSCSSTSPPPTSTSATSSACSACSTRCARAAWPCWRWSTTCRARRPGRSRMVLLAGGRVAAEGPPRRRAGERRLRAGLRGGDPRPRACPGLPHPLYSVRGAPMTR